LKTRDENAFALENVLSGPQYRSHHLQPQHNALSKSQFIIIIASIHAEVFAHMDCWIVALQVQEDMFVAILIFSCRMLNGRQLLSFWSGSRHGRRGRDKLFRICSSSY